jgi:ribonuclease D
MARKYRRRKKYYTKTTSRARSAKRSSLPRSYKPYVSQKKTSTVSSRSKSSIKIKTNHQVSTNNSNRSSLLKLSPTLGNKFNVCKNRQKRREVLFAKNKSGINGMKKRSTTPWSKITC